MLFSSCMLRTVLLTFCVCPVLASSVLAGQSDGHQDIPVLTVCQALKDPLKHSGSIVVVVGSWVGTGEGSWLSETCDLKVVINGRAYAPSLWTSYTPSDQAPPPRLPVGFKWDKPAIRQALAEVKKTTLLQHRAGWYAIFGRLEVDASSRNSPAGQGLFFRSMCYDCIYRCATSGTKRRIGSTGKSIGSHSKSRRWCLKTTAASYVQTG